MLTEMTQDHSHALANLATATQSDRTTVANMSKIIDDLTLQLGQANMRLEEAQSSIAILNSKRAKTGTRPNHYITSPTGPSDITTIDKDGYYWSHGFKVAKGQNSSTCENQKNGHMTTATKYTTMDRRVWNKYWDK